MKNRCTPQIDSNSPPDACASFQLIQLFLETVDSLQHVGTRWMLYLQKRWSRIHTSNQASLLKRCCYHFAKIILIRYKIHLLEFKECLFNLTVLFCKPCSLICLGIRCFLAIWYFSSIVYPET